MIPNLKLYGYGIGALALVIGYFFWHHHVYQQGYDKGAETVQVQFDDYRGKIQRLTEQKRLEAAQKLAEVLKSNAEAMNVYQSEIDRINAQRGLLSRQLQNYYAGACSRGMPAYQDRPEAAATGQESSGLPEALDDFVQACRSDAAQLDALIAEVKANQPAF